MKPAARASVGIIGGRGRTGRQFARLFRAQGFRVQVTGSKDQERNRKLISGCDILVFSLPLSRAAAHIAQLAEHATRKDQLVIDVSSLKEHEVRAMMRFPGEVIGMHPLFGPSTDAKGERVILCPARAKQSSVRFLKRFLSCSGISAT
jgi:prephenate dehydrogenase